MEFDPALFDDDDGGGEGHAGSLFSIMRPMSGDGPEDSSIPADEVRLFLESGAMTYSHELSKRTRPWGEEEEGGAAADVFLSAGKTRKKLEITCSNCGASGRTIKNCGGGTRETINHPAKYKIYCQPALGGCGFKAMVDRDPDENGHYKQTESNFALEGERKRCKYMCGKCGEEKVLGHTNVCKGVKTAPTAPNLLGSAFAQDTEQDEAFAPLLPVLASTAQGQPPLVAPTSGKPAAPLVPPPLPSASMAPLVALPPLPSASMAPAADTVAPSAVGSVASVAQPLAVPVAQPPLVPPLPSVAPISALVASPAAAASVAQPPPAPVVQPPSASMVPPTAAAPAAQPPPPHAAPALVSQAPVVPVAQPPPPPLVSAEPAVSAASAPEPSDDEKEEEGNSSTLLSIAKAGVVDAAKNPRNGNVAISLLKLTRYKVKGDGSCWVYAMLTCAGLYQSCHLRVENNPSPRDRGMDRWCRHLAFLWLKDHTHILEQFEIDALDDIVEVLPQYPFDCEKEDDYGSFGTINTIRGLAAYLDVSVVCWNKATMRTSNTMQQVIIHLHDTEAPLEMKEKNMTPAEIVRFCQSDPRVMHIEWTGNHYSALVPPTPVPIHDVQKNILMLIPPVVDETPEEKKESPTTAEEKTVEVPDDWLHLANLCRYDLVFTRVKRKVINKLTFAELLERTRKEGHHALMFSTIDDACYIDFPDEKKVTRKDFLKAGDFECDIYIDKTWLQNVKGSMPIDAKRKDACFCNRCFFSKKFIIGCTMCGKMFHNDCVYVDPEESTDEWKCNECADA